MMLDFLCRVVVAILPHRNARVNPIGRAFHFSQTTRQLGNGAESVLPPNFTRERYRHSAATIGDMVHFNKWIS